MSFRTFSSALLTIVLPLASASAAVFTSDTLIGATDFSYDNQDVVISNCIVTVDGPHTLLSLRVATGGTLTHLNPLTTTTNAGLFLTISNDVEIEPGAFINANGIGYTGGAGAGAGTQGGGPPSGSGGGYGGNGGISSSNAPGGAAYGNAMPVPFPTAQLGSGGGLGSGGPGASGGGAIQLTVGGRLIVNGLVSANGASATNSRSGGGSGGGILLSANSFEGAGSLIANGGAGEPIHGGGGGGGRIAVTYSTSSFMGTLMAVGGPGWQAGGAGTLFLATNQLAAGIIIDNGGVSGAITPLDLQIGPTDLLVQGKAIVGIGVQNLHNVIVRSNSSVVPYPTNSQGVSVTASSVTIEQGASINVDGRGFAPSIGPGVGQISSSIGGGSGHGGYGGNGIAGATGAFGGTVYDSVSSPSLSGSGGRSVGSFTGGTGGGTIRLQLSGRLQLDGRLSADGTAGTGSSGGASGGSIWLTTSNMLGSGVLSANGGAGGLPFGGGGGGGRISISYNSVTNPFAGTISAHGGTGAVPGGAGTIFSAPFNGAYGNLTMDNGGLKGTNTVLDLQTVLALSVLGGASATSTLSSFTITSVLIDSNSIWSPAANTFTLNASGNVTVSGVLSADGASTSTSGIGASSSIGSGGGGLGGSGGRGAGASGGYFATLSSSPSSVGPRGGSFNGTGPLGGGAMRLNVTGVLTVDGRITANGLSTVSNNNGGAAGGSIWLSVGGLSGLGVIRADGGSGHLPQGGGGSGGRIALYYNSNSFSGTFSAKGGVGFGNGGAGTLFLKSNLSPNPTFIVDNGGLLGTNTVLDSSTFQEVKVLGGAWLSNSSSSFLTLSNLVISSNSVFTPGISSWTLTATTANIAGLLSLDSVSTGANNPGFSSSFGSGGGGGQGAGGAGAGASGGLAISSISSPSLQGGRGGNPFGGSIGGGGGLRLNISGLLTLDGRITANGGNGVSNPSSGSGGGGGGSVWVTTGGIGGTGNISANGGDGWLPLNGGGGGGHVSVTYTSNTFAGIFSAKGGLGFVNGGAGSIYFKKSSSPFGNLTFDNGGTPTTSPSIWDSTASGIGEVLVAGGSSVTSSLLSLSISNLTLLSNSSLSFGSSLTLSLSGTGSVASAASLSLDGGGTTSGAFNSSSGSGGAGHAGDGGSGFAAGGGGTTGNAATPTTQGARGGSSISPGANGGGALHLTANGSLLVNGRISANGTSTSTNNNGGGSGGSVWLSVGTLSGNGVIAADGGSGHLPAGGGGGGGRVAAYFNTNKFIGTFSAKGGAGWQAGGAGTVYLKTNNANSAVVTVDNGGLRGTNTAVSPSGTFDLIVQGGALATAIGTPRDLIVHSNGWVGRAFLETGIVSVSRNATFDAGGGILLDGQSLSLIGAGLNSTSVAGGGGHGGNGGRKFGGSGAAVDQVTGPTLPGGGGGNGSGTSAAPLGGKGGDAMQLSVASVLTVNGSVSASGADGDINSGGGAGGGLWLSASTIAGSGSISANGGRGNGSGGGGAGGRIAIYYNSNLFTGTLNARGGTGYEAGGAGTVFLKDNAQTNGFLTLDNGGVSGAFTPISQLFGVPEYLTVANGAIGQIQGAIPVLSNLTVLATGRLTGSSADTNLNLAVSGNLNIASNAVVDADCDGNSLGSGSGAGASLNSQGAGGGYGGTGGASASGAVGGITYGSNSQPVDRGSGGGFGSGPVGGSQGGGAIRLTVGGQFNLDGLLSANGCDGSQDDSGGGSGGSVWLTAGSITGSGTIAASGGDGEPVRGGGGGGGRIALYSLDNNFLGQFSTAGGVGASSGSTGTVFTSASLPGLAVTSQSPIGFVSNTVSVVTLGFSSPIDPSSLAGTVASLATPAGPLPDGSIVLSEASASAVNVSFPVQNIPGDYVLQFGPGIMDLFGQTLSQVYTGAFTISVPLILGSVHDTNGNPIAGVRLQQTDGLLLTATTDANGNYSMGVNPGWSGTIIPSSGNSLFAPGSRAYSNVSVNVSNQDYLIVSSIMPVLTSTTQNGNLALNWYGISGVNYQAQYSTNLSDWLPYNGPLPGTNGPSLLLVPIDPMDAAKFFRVQATN